MTLRLAYNTNGASSHRLDDALSLIADSGYQGVALTLDHHHLDPFAAEWRAQTERLKQRLDELGLGSVIETGARYLLNPREKHEPTLLNPSLEGRARRIQFLCRAIDIAAILGSETVSFWAGVPKPEVAPDQATAWLHEGLGAVCDYAADKQVSVSLEPEPGMLVETVGDYVAVAERHPSLRLALDTGHCLVTQDIAPDQAVRNHADRLGTVSVEDMKIGDHTHLPFGEGDMDLPAVVAALNDIAFTGLVCVEYSRESPRAHLAIPEAAAALRAAGA
ncbi:sugar phosphate isomerase/epimerase family protein [Sphingomonas kaistensis]|uniref:Sugar phosphate isomerase/epimerase family protein n=1 Tax=Sphingomonas kaistensis TaxID=298708 RepID=A0ABZ2G189_9SPHN